MGLSQIVNNPNVFYYVIQDRIFTRFPIAMINYPIAHFIRADNSCGRSIVFDDNATPKNFILDAVEQYLSSKKMEVYDTEYQNKVFTFYWEREESETLKER